MATVADDLSGDMLDHFAARGWVAAPGFFDAAETDAITRWTEEVTVMPELSGRQMVYREPSLLDPDTKVIQRIEDFCPFHSGFDALVRESRLQRAVEQLFGAAALLFKDKINFKMPGGAGFTPHQDQQAGWSAYAPIFITALVSIDPATIANGCLEMARSPRTTGMIGQEWAPLDDAQMAALDVVPVPTAPGDVLFFDSYAPHSSKPNLTASQRRILYLTYNRASDGDQRALYFADKRASFPPDVDRVPGAEYTFRV